jgi:hypothetical protein
MDLADEAFRLQRIGQSQQAQTLFKEALDLEREAALLLPATQESEPSRAILFRSAAALAYNAEDYEAAERLVAYGLTGFPPSEIKEELKNLYEDINFKRHLQVSGIVLSENQWLMSIYGNVTSFGGTLVEPLLTRVDRITALFYRTVERMLGVDYRVTGSSRKEIKDAYGLYVNTFAPASFAVSFQIGAPDPQMQLWEHEPVRPLEADSVIDELMQCLELWESGKSDELKEQIDNKVYYENFIGIVKQIAPDGDDVKIVGFKSVRHGRERPLILRRTRAKIRPSVQLTDAQPSIQGETEKATFTGILKYASSPQTKPFGSVHVFDAEGVMHPIRVPISLMKDVVRPYYEERVIVAAEKRGDNYYLEDIDGAPLTE